jgi:hypothetical protein
MGMKKRLLGLILTWVGIVILLVSLFGDLIGIGGYPGLGYKQVIGIIAGAVMSIIGVVMTRK